MKRFLAGFSFAVFLVACQNTPRFTDDETPIVPGTVSPAPQTRGANITFNSDTYLTLTESAFDTWQSWGINLLRFTFDKDDFFNAFSNPPTAGDIWIPYAANLLQLEKILGWMKARGMKAMISLDHIWGDDHNSQAMWASGGNNSYLQHRIDLCGAMATWIYGNGFSATVQYLEPWNEPYPCNAEHYKDKFLPDAIAAIRASGFPGVTISIMPPHDWGLLWGFEGWDGISDSGVIDSNVIYSTHIYAPQTYTHQGVLSGYPYLSTGWPGYYKNYPSDPAATYSDMDAGRALTDVIVDFEVRAGKEVIVTEFGVARWAIGSGLWARDLISIMEESGIGWMYHSIAGWNGWNPSFKASDPESKMVFGRGSPTLDLLKYYWGQ